MPGRYGAAVFPSIRAHQHALAAGTQQTPDLAQAGGQIACPERGLERGDDVEHLRRERQSGERAPANADPAPGHVMAVAHRGGRYRRSGGGHAVDGPRIQGKLGQGTAATAQIEDHVAHPQPQGTHDLPLHGSLPVLLQVQGKTPPDVPGADDMLPDIHALLLACGRPQKKLALHALPVYLN